MGVPKMIDRRGILAGAGALTAAATLSPRNASSQRLARQQIVRYGLGFDDIRTLDPHMATLSSDIPIVANVNEALLAVPDGNLASNQPMPALAERWEASSDARTWTFFLRQGVEWHDGHGAFTSADVVFSVARVRSGETGSPFRSTLGNVTGVEADGSQRVRFSLEYPDPFFPRLMVNFQGGYLVSKHAVEAGVNLTSRLVGTGPFRFRSYQARDKLILERNDAYWGGRPGVESIVFQFMSQASARELALRTGDIDVIDIESRQDVVERLRRARQVVETTAVGVPYVLYINLTKRPFDDIRVRQALAHATDRDNLLAFVGRDLGKAEHSSVPEGYAGHVSTVRQYPLDLDRARSLLREAGHPDGFSTEVIVSNSVLYLPIMQVLQEQWKKAGINVSLRVVDHPTFHRLIRQDASPLVIYNASRYPQTAQVYLEQFYAGPASIGKPTAITNFSHYGDAIPGVDDLLQSARAASSAEETQRLWAQAQEKIAQDVPSLPLYNLASAMARSPRLEVGYQLHSQPYYVYGPRTRLLAG